MRRLTCFVGVKGFNATLWRVFSGYAKQNGMTTAEALEAVLRDYLKKVGHL